MAHLPDVTRVPADPTGPTRRRVLGAGIAGMVLAGCHRSSTDSSAPADAAAQQKVVDRVRTALASASALAGGHSPTPVRHAAADLGSALRAQLRLLGGEAAPSASKATAAHTVAAARLITVDGLDALGGTSGPMARLLACVAAGALVRTRALALAAGQNPVRPPRAGELPPLDDDDILVRISGHPPVIGAPVSDQAAAAMAALSTSLRTAEYGYGLVAARTRGPRRPVAVERMGSHRRAALSLDTLGDSVSRPMPTAQLSYPVKPPADDAQGRSLARRLELDVAFAEARVIAELTPEVAAARNLFADHLVTVALAAGRWGAVPALPGMNPG